jgi:hypothetical protein
MPDTAWPVHRSPPGSSRDIITTPVLMSSILFRHVNSGSLSFVFWLTPDTLYGVPFPQCSPPRLLTDAAYGGLKPSPARRLRRAYLHLLRSITFGKNDLLHRASSYVRVALITEKNDSTKFIQLAPVGVKCSVTRLFLANHFVTSGAYALSSCHR